MRTGRCKRLDRSQTAQARGHQRACVGVLASMHNRAGLLRAACAALPCLAEAELKHAVSAAVVTKDGQPLLESDLMDLVAELRKAWRQVSLDAESTLPGGGTDRSPLILLVDATLGRLPWESIPLLRDVAVCRLPSAAFVSTSMSAARRLMRVDDRNKPAPTTSKATSR